MLVRRQFGDTRALVIPLQWNLTLWQKLSSEFVHLAMQASDGLPNEHSPAFESADLHSAGILGYTHTRSYGERGECEVLRVDVDGNIEIMRVRDAELWEHLCPNIQTINLLRLLVGEAANVWPELQYLSVTAETVGEETLNFISRHIPQLVRS
jgi:hypothetical protein